MEAAPAHPAPAPAAPRRKMSFGRMLVLAQRRFRARQRPPEPAATTA